MTMTWNDKLMMITTWNDDKLKQLTASKGLSEEAKAAVCMFMNCLRFNEIEPEEIHVCLQASWRKRLLLQPSMSAGNDGFCLYAA